MPIERYKGFGAKEGGRSVTSNYEFTAKDNYRETYPQGLAAYQQLRGRKKQRPTLSS